MRIKGFLFGVSLAAATGLAAVAQDAVTPPKVIQLQREFIKPGKAGVIHDKSEANFVAAMNHGKLQGHYVALNSMTGKLRALFLVGYPSFAALEADNQIIDKSAALTAELDRALVTDGELLSDYDGTIATFDEDLSYKPHGDISHARYFEISAFHIKPGHRHEWQELVKMVKEGNEKGGTSSHWATYEVAYGAEDGTYIVLSGDKSLAEIDQAFGENKKFMEGMGGPEGMAKLEKLMAETVDSSRTELFSINPKQSYPDEAWVKGDPDFWKPKMQATSAKPAAKPAAAPKPGQ
jgi:hypothetical protein